MKQHEYHEFMKSRTLNWRRQPFSYDHRHRHARFALWIRNQWCMDHRGAWALAVYIMSLNDPLRTTDYSITSTIITWATHQYSRCMSLHVGFPPSPIHHIALRWHFGGTSCRGECGAGRDRQQRRDPLYSQSLTSWATASWPNGVKTWNSSWTLKEKILGT